MAEGWLCLAIRSIYDEHSSENKPSSSGRGNSGMGAIVLFAAELSFGKSGRGVPGEMERFSGGLALSGSGQRCVDHRRSSVGPLFDLFRDRGLLCIYR